MTTSDLHPTDEQQHKDFIEGLKVSYDLFKHLTTLSTGSILLLATLLEKFFKAPSWTPLIGLIFIGFSAALVGSLAMMYLFARAIGKSGLVNDATLVSLGVAGFVGSVFGFLSGIGALVAFTLKNFYL